MSNDHPTTSAGIYQIRHVADGKVYVGSAINIRKRWREHVNALKRRDHHSVTLQRAWDKHGQDGFAFEILRAVCKKENLVRIEQEYIDRKRSFDASFGYNIRPTAGSSLGFKASPETRARLSELNKGKTLSPEHRANISAAQKGRRPSDATIAASVARCKGKELSEDRKAALSVAALNRSDQARANIAAANAKASLTRTVSPEGRARKSAASKGNTHAAGYRHTDEAKAKIAAASRAMKRTPDHGAKIAASKIGKKRSPETIEKIRATRLANREAAAIPAQNEPQFPDHSTDTTT